MAGTILTSLIHAINVINHLGTWLAYNHFVECFLLNVTIVGTVGPSLVRFFSFLQRPTHLNCKSLTLKLKSFFYSKSGLTYLKKHTPFKKTPTEEPSQIKK